MQSDAFDFIALAIGIVVTSQPVTLGPFSTQRLSKPCELYNLVAVAVTSVFSDVMYIVAFKTLAHESWYQPDTSDESHVSPASCDPALKVSCALMQALCGKLCMQWHFQICSLYHWQQ